MLRKEWEGKYRNSFVVVRNGRKAGSNLYPCVSFSDIFIDLNYKWCFREGKKGLKLNTIYHQILPSCYFNFNSQICVCISYAWKKDYFKVLWAQVWWIKTFKCDTATAISVGCPVYLFSLLAWCDDGDDYPPPPASLSQSPLSHLYKHLISDNE